MATQAKKKTFFDKPIVIRADKSIRESLAKLAVFYGEKQGFPASHSSIIRMLIRNAARNIPGKGIDTV